jgi:aspartate 1-decarboxylase
MRRFAFKSKIHRATVTDANVDYEGSLSVDEDLLEAADILPYEQLHVWDVTNGARLVTYALPAPRGSGTVQVNGGGAHHVRKGDLVIVATFTMMPSRRLKKYRPTVIFVDENNRIKPPPAAAAPAPEPPVDEATETPEAEPGRETLRRKKKR